jgi:hypothetical protein
MKYFAVMVNGIGKNTVNDYPKKRLVKPNFDSPFKEVF